MKSRIACSLFCCLALAGPLRGQTFEVPVSMSDGSHTGTLVLGVHPGGTDGFDAGLDQFAPPPPPAGAFDARSVIHAEGFLTDVRDNATTEKVFHLRYQAASGGGPIVVSWDTTGLAGLGTFFITDDFTGALFGPLDMTTTDRLDVSTTGGVLDDRLRVHVVPGVSSFNTAPVAEDDAATTQEEAPRHVEVLANDTDADGDALIVTRVGDPEHGTASVRPDGTIRYVPERDYHGNDAFSYVVDDGRGGSAQATVRLTVTPVNDAPVFASTPPTGVVVGQRYRYAAAATDVDGDRLVLSAPARPAWLGFSTRGDGTAMLEGMPGGGDGGDHEVVLEAADGTVAVQQRFTISVSGTVNLPPAPTAPTTPADGATISLEGEPGAAFVVSWEAASDPDGDPVSYRWEASLTRDFAVPLFREDTGTVTRFETTVGAVASALTAAGTAVGASVGAFHRVISRDGVSETVGPTREVTLVRGVFVGIEEETPHARLVLLGNYPNPFSQVTTIQYALAEPATVRLVVYDAVGRRVAALVDAQQPPGTFEQPFDASGLCSGTYFYRLEAGPHQHVKAMIVMQ